VVNWQDPNLHFVDLTGDGIPDVLLVQGDQLTWYPALGKDGWGEPRIVRMPRDEEKAPVVVWADPRQAVLLADMTGDGLNDIVGVRPGSVCYWPNLGYGKFGEKRLMLGELDFGPRDQFHGARVRVGDVDGSGTADLVYLGADGARAWINQAGNGY